MSEIKRFQLPPEVISKIDKYNGFDKITVEDMEKYISPVFVNRKFEQEIIEQEDNAIMAQIEERIGVAVDKEELIKALNYDRDSYRKGVNDGYFKRDKEIIRCEDCELKDSEYAFRNYYWCTHFDHYVRFDEFCARGKKQTENLKDGE